MARFRSAAASTNNTVPTMQTMMRIGSVSVTDTGRHNSGRISVSSVSADHVHPAGNSIGVTRLTEGADLQSSLSAAPGKKQRSKLSKDHHHSIHFDVADGDCENSIDERTQAETSFISIPLSEHQDNSSRGKTSKPSGRHRNDSRVAILPPIKDSTDDHEISEITPFCTTTES
ncbi:unnamed protein product [Allacma fusca]|uniref:Uncharacterized protein n=1 Tax=Allacma fusca TaxID=39272 RepID=A0A8J2NY72_9HEXA|nr:unnamed protein product [Allacma fusca]